MANINHHQAATHCDVKRILSEPNTLPHIVQLPLTFDPVLVEQVTRQESVSLFLTKIACLGCYSAVPHHGG